MIKKIHFFIIDDDAVVLEEQSRILKRAGHDVTTFTSSETVIKSVTDLQPDCVLCDLLLPGIDGIDLFQQIRQIKNIKQPVFIIITGKQFEYDQRRSLELGVDGYLTKPINLTTFLDHISEIMHGRIIIKFWGCRGTLTVPGIKTNRYGGNTNCVTFKIANKYFFIFDAGTGIKELSNYLVKENQFPLKAKIFITHPHYDHINGLPFFLPLYMKGNDIEILGANQHGHSIEKVISGQMDSYYFPVTMKEFSARVTFRAIAEETIKIDEITIKTMLLNHPGRCLGFRVEYENKVFCYVTDNELYLEDSAHYNQFEVDRLIHFVQNADVLVIDTTYRDEDYMKKVSWGHSCVSRVVDIADKAKIKLLCLHHHDPDQTDDDIDIKLDQAISLLRSRNSTTRCIAPREGESIIIGDNINVVAVTS